MLPLVLGDAPLPGGSFDAAAGEDDDVPAAPVVVSGWEGLRGIVAQQRADAAEAAEAARRPVACVCGWPLQTGPGGVRFCPVDGAQYGR